VLVDQVVFINWCGKTNFEELVGTDLIASHIINFTRTGFAAD
jgi:hypothetical protein